MKKNLLKNTELTEYIDGVFRYFEYLIIVGGTFGVMYQVQKNLFTSILFFAFLGFLGLTSQTVIEKLLSNRFLVFLSIILLIGFNACFINFLMKTIFSLSS